MLAALLLLPTRCQRCKVPAFEHAVVGPVDPRQQQNISWSIVLVSDVLGVVALQTLAEGR